VAFPLAGFCDVQLLRNVEDNIDFIFPSGVTFGMVKFIYTEYQEINAKKFSNNNIPTKVKGTVPIPDHFFYTDSSKFKPVPNPM